MKKERNLIIGLIVLSSLLGCTDEDFLLKNRTGDEECRSVSVQVVDGGYIDNLATRARESNGEENNGEDTMLRTRFMPGDKIGVFSVSTDGAVHYKNMELAYDGTEWKNPEGKSFYHYTDMYYFAYYPFVEDFDIGKIDWSKNSAAGFFARLINGWMPHEDQSTTLKYMESDLMVGEGEIDDEGNFSFTLGHTMGLIFISAAEEIKGTVYLFPKLTEADAMENLSEESRLYTFEQKVYKPSRKEGYYRYLVKPGQPTFISGVNPDKRTFGFSCADVSAGRYRKYVIDGGFDPSESEIEDFTVRIGDVLFNDMHIEHRPEDGSKVKGAAAGIIVYLADHNDEYTDGYIHGLVLAGKITNYEYSKAWTNKDELFDYSCLATCNTVREAIEDKTGLANCLALNELYNEYRIVDHNTMDAIHDKASPWFYFSSGQWIKVICGWGGTIITPLNKSAEPYSRTLEFSYQSNIQPGNTKVLEDLKYMWTPFFPTTNTSNENPACKNTIGCFTCTESSRNGYDMWFLYFYDALSETSPFAKIHSKKESIGKQWRGLAF